MEYDRRVMPATSARKLLGFAPHLFALFCVLLAAIAYPLLVENDPWHGHVVFGGSDRADRVSAMRSHRHTYNDGHSHQVPVTAGAASVISISERGVAMLASLLGVSHELVAGQGQILPIWPLVLTFIWLAAALAASPLLRTPPPIPPPRS